MKPYIDGIIVVEGNNDASLISSLINSEIITLNGCELQNIKYLEKASKYTNIYLLTDPDEEGKRIRSKILKILPECINTEIDITKCTKNSKNGIAECEKSELLRVLGDYLQENYELKDNPIRLFNKKERELICKQLEIEEVNNKQLNRRLKRLQITNEEIEKMLGE